MGYGALLTDSAGVPFYIDGSMPLTLLSANYYPVGETDIHAADGAVRFVFCNSTSPDVSFFYYRKPGGNFAISAVGAAGSNFRCFIFGYQFQPVPAWGIQINDDQGRCILTNETKPLRGVERVGQQGSDSAGFNINQTLNGSYAVAPEMLGYVTGVINQGGQAYPYNNPVFTSAYLTGGQTVIKAVGRGDGGGGGASGISYNNYRNSAKVINVSRY